jgi:hypothetical protein
MAKYVVGKPEGKRPLGKSENIWKVRTDIKADRKEIGCEDTEWIQLA